MQEESNNSTAATSPATTFASGTSNEIITVVRDVKNTLGKEFRRNAAGEISKKSTVSLSFGAAVMHRVETHEELAELLKTVGDDPYAAIINASFDGIDVGEEFIILSENEITKRLGIPGSDREKQKGVHQIEQDGKTLKAVGRFKENVRPSTWQLLDRDIDAHTPSQFTNLSVADWLSSLSTFIPGIDTVTYVETASTSSRVVCDGKPVGGGNGHVWIKIDGAAKVEHIRSAVPVLAAQAEKTWLKPRFSRTEKGKVVGQSLTTLIDPSVWTPGRLVFNGKPTALDGLTVVPQTATVHQRQCGTLDTSRIILPDPKAVREVTRKAGIEMSVTSNGDSLRIAANDLTLNTEIETKDHGALSIREIIERGLVGKMRCQSPFRDSSSYAAFYDTNAEGLPFVYDVGTGVTHWVNPFEAEEVKLVKANGIIDKLIGVVKDDSSAALEDEAVNALTTIKQLKPSDYQRKRAALKQANPKVSLTALDSAVKSWSSENNAAQTHHGYACSLLATFEAGASRPVGHHGALYVVDPDTGLWNRLPVEQLVRRVAELHDGKDNCARSSDYKAIAEHAISLVTDDSFFADAPVGIACLGEFYQIDGDTITNVKLLPDHRQHVMLSFKPEAHPIPQFKTFLHETFESKHAGEESQQIELIQEISGAIMLGLMPRFQKAVMYFDPFGRSGKGTMERCQRGLVPTEFITAVSPFSWGKDYFVAALAGSRLNVVGEMPDNESIPAAMFKTVLGGDLITGRHPTHRPITFTNEAAHLFMSNHLINTRDHSEAFFARWLVIEFPNSRLRTGLPIDPMLAKRISASEMPGIAYWALEGAARLMKNGAFSKSSAHDRLMNQWRRSANSLEEFIGEECTLSQDSQYRRSDFYRDYTSWCSDNGRKPFAKGRVKDLLEHNIGMGIRLVELNGHETFKGVMKKSAHVEYVSPQINMSSTVSGSNQPTERF